ncbi:putative carboxylesterase 12 [Apium graveolens]|uniref:putative carboxylesterase 12 n=1 Tax=Apium graveolens TaxID=4045 RepID=UPI003D78F6C2
MFSSLRRPRRPPEHHVPIAYEDSWTAIRWVASHADGTGQEAWLNEFADFGRVHLVGDSAGANIAHCMAIRAGSEKVDGINFDGLILMHPYFWGKDPVGEETDDTERRAFIERYWLLACPTSSGVDDPWMNPGLDPKLSSLVCKRALIFGAEEDFLKYRAKYYGEVLGQSGWAGTVEVVETEGEVHVFHLYKPKTQKTRELIHKVVSFIYKDKAHSI